MRPNDETCLRPVFLLFTEPPTSPIAMSHLTGEGNRISHPAAHRLRPINGLPTPHYIDQQSLIGSTHSVTHPAVLRHARSGLSGQQHTSSHRQGCAHHQCPAWRHARESRRSMFEKHCLTFRLIIIKENLLDELGLAPVGFDLNGISNIVWCKLEVSPDNDIDITFALQ